MVVSIISERGTVPLLRVSARVKINAENFVNYVLKPLFSVDLTRLYSNEIDKVFMHHDNYSANLTTSYLVKFKEELGKDRSRFNQKRIQPLEKGLKVDISKVRRTHRANKKDPSKTFKSIKIN